MIYSQASAHETPRLIWTPPAWRGRFGMPAVCATVYVLLACPSHQACRITSQLHPPVPCQESGKHRFGRRFREMTCRNLFCNLCAGTNFLVDGLLARGSVGVAGQRAPDPTNVTETCKLPWFRPASTGLLLSLWVEADTLIVNHRPEPGVRVRCLGSINPIGQSSAVQ